jgi:hypothetical protein
MNGIERSNSSFVYTTTLGGIPQTNHVYNGATTSSRREVRLQNASIRWKRAKLSDHGVDLAGRSSSGIADNYDRATSSSTPVTPVEHWPHKILELVPLKEVGVLQVHQRIDCSILG